MIPKGVSLIICPVSWVPIYINKIPITIPKIHPHHLFWLISNPATNNKSNATHTKGFIVPNEDTIPKKIYKIKPNTNGKKYNIFFILLPPMIIKDVSQKYLIE